MNHPLARIFAPISLIVFSAVVVVATSLNGSNDRVSVEPVVIATVASDTTASQVFEIEPVDPTAH